MPSAGRGGTGDLRRGARGRTGTEDESPNAEKAPEAKALAEKARPAGAEAKDAYRTALAPYREACRKAGAACEYEGGRSANVSEKVSFLVERTDKGVRVMVKGQPKTEEVIPLAALRESTNKAASVPPSRRNTPLQARSNADRAFLRQGPRPRGRSPDGTLTDALHVGYHIALHVPRAYPARGFEVPP